MIDPHLLRDDLDTVIAALSRRGMEADQVRDLAELEARRRALVGAVDDARAEQKEASSAIGRADPDERPAMIERATTLKASVTEAEQRLAEAEQAWHDAIVRVPNLPDTAAPDGQEGDGLVLRTVGERPTFDFDHRDHVELLERVDALDVERGAKVSGARFTYLKGEGVRLALALVQYALSVAARHGHRAVLPPILVRREAMYGTGFLPTDEQQIFRTDDRDDLYLTGTSEVALAGLHMDEILDELPVRYAGYSPCFRREAGTYGKDTRGMFRVHQFDKVELFSFVAADDAPAEHERLLAIEEELFTGLELHYQVVDIPVGDLGASAARKFDIEAWMPGQDAFREVTSTSNTTDYQARRLNTRVRGEDGTELVHTLNGTAVAVPRAIIALVETHQREDGSVRVPDALVPFLGTDVLFD
ncbi:serine--tRNA ligase [Salsipaludibacter albus]|uniref:serine--tRNA ligase n=1 Tax=Salsipaludibacter albus TaxID=2849650 RepID=UPI001EE40448|nr:serine--tRNA ligase [Salsipaludibacter albus]MBY5161427.1 serine--tRNA ligase [Salsipaludibacter albus]